VRPILATEISSLGYSMLDGRDGSWDVAKIAKIESIRIFGEERFRNRRFLIRGLIRANDATHL
jgi:hypothetical protein